MEYFDTRGKRWNLSHVKTTDLDFNINIMKSVLIEDNMTHTRGVKPRPLASRQPITSAVTSWHNTTSVLIGSLMQTRSTPPEYLVSNDKTEASVQSGVEYFSDTLFYHLMTNKLWELDYVKKHKYHKIRAEIWTLDKYYECKTEQKQKNGGVETFYSTVTETKYINVISKSLGVLL